MALAQRNLQQDLQDPCYPAVTENTKFLEQRSSQKGLRDDEPIHSPELKTYSAALFPFLLEGTRDAYMRIRKVG